MMQVHKRPIAGRAPLQAHRQVGAVGRLWRGRGAVVVVAATPQQQEKKPAKSTPPAPASLGRSEGDMVTLRSEAEAPFRSLRFVLFGFGLASSGMALLISLPQLAGALGGARNAMAVSDVGTNIAINLTAAVSFALLLRNDWLAREKQIARLGREEALGSLPVRLANGKTLPLSALRGRCRAVIVAGTPQQVAEGVAAAEPYKEALMARGVFVVPLPVYDETSTSGGGSASAPATLPELTPEDLRWRGEAAKRDQWAQWFATQLRFSKASSDSGLFVGLRLDGRVRSSGMGPPPWKRYSLELGPLEGPGQWSGFLDGFDGRIGSFD